jgi:hydrogenase maturation protease
MSDSRLLVIAYGNPLRGDDGLAWLAAKQLKTLFASSDVEILEQQQLVPEIAEAISRVTTVVFIDAAAPQAANTHPGAIAIVEIAKEETKQVGKSPFHHHFSPTSLLALTAQLYGVRPRAFIATLTGEDFGPGERLSAAVEQAMPEFLAQIEKVIRES